MTDQDARNVAIAKEYFRRSDARDPGLMDLFHPDLQFYYPKFGIGHGPGSVLDMVSGFATELEAIEHDRDSLLYIARDPYVIVEGTSRGRLNGADWAGGKTAGGRFCNVFAFRDGLIARCHVYLDPDYTGQDEARFRWGHDRQEW